MAEHEPEQNNTRNHIAIVVLFLEKRHLVLRNNVFINKCEMIKEYLDHTYTLGKTENFTLE